MSINIETPNVWIPVIIRLLNYVLYILYNICKVFLLWSFSSCELDHLYTCILQKNLMCNWKYNSYIIYFNTLQNISGIFNTTTTPSIVIIIIKIIPIHVMMGKVSIFIMQNAIKFEIFDRRPFHLLKFWNYFFYCLLI